LRQQRRSSIRLDQQQQQQQQPTGCCKYQIPKCVNDPSSLCFCDLRDETHICTVQGYLLYAAADLLDDDPVPSSCCLLLLQES
jgi:hypothetical protein